VKSLTHVRAEAARGLTPIKRGRTTGRIVDSSSATAGGRGPDTKEVPMDPRRRMWAMVEPFDPPEIDEDAAADALREATLLLDVPEWVDPETGELADDEPHRLETH